MRKGINVSKSYIVNRTADESFNRLNAIVSSSYNGSAFSTCGSLNTTEPPEFLLRLKRVAFSTLPADVFSTKLSVWLLKMNGNTRIDIKTKTNPAYLIWILLVPSICLIQVLTKKQPEVIPIIGTAILVVVIFLIIDRLSKNMLIAGFEEDFKINPD